MNGRRFCPPGALAGLAVALVLCGPGRAADVLVLEDGRRLTVDAWWEESGRVVYEKYGGTVGIPRSQITEILPGPDGPDERMAPVPGTRGYGAPRPALPPASPSLDLPLEPLDEPGLEPGESTGPTDRATLEERYRDHPEQRGQLARPLAIALIREGNDAMRAGDPATASARYERAVGLVPDLQVARANLAMAYLALDRNRDALTQADTILRSHPDDTDALYVKGLALYRDERTQEAIRIWEQAETIAPSDRTGARLAKARREHAVDGDYRTSAAAHFLLRYDDQSTEAALGETILAFLEDRFRTMVSRYNYLPESVIIVILYPRDDFHHVTQTGAYTGGLFDGKIRVPVGNARNLNDTLQRTLVHELTHSFVHGKTRGTCPAWLHEGLAQLEEGRRSTAGTLLSLARGYRADDPAWGKELDYPASLALTEYLVARRGFPAILTLLEQLGQGATESKAVQSALGTDMSGLLQQWGESLAKGEVS